MSPGSDHALPKALAQRPFHRPTAAQPPAYLRRVSERQIRRQLNEARRCRGGVWVRRRGAGIPFVPVARPEDPPGASTLFSPRPGPGVHNTQPIHIWKRTGFFALVATFQSAYVTAGPPPKDSMYPTWITDRAHHDVKDGFGLHFGASSLSDLGKGLQG